MPEKKRESALKSALMAEIKAHLPGFVAQRHEDVRTSGTPDLSLTGRARTSWWEFKHGTPDFESHGIQELTMLRLAASSFHARYVVWEERRGVKRTLVVHPKHIECEDLGAVAEAWWVEFDLRQLVDHMRRVHGA